MTLLEQIEQWKRRRGEDPHPLERLLADAAKERIVDAPSVARLHEALLFLRAYPHSKRVANLADEILKDFSVRTSSLSGDLSALEEAEISGIAGTRMSAVHSYETARSLAARYPSAIDVDWEWCEDPGRAAPVVAAIAPPAAEEWPVEAHMPVPEWVEALKAPGETSLEWILKGVSRLPCSLRQRAAMYDSMGLLLTWNLGDSAAARTHTRLQARTLFIHREPLIQRREVSLETELAGQPLPVRKLPVREARLLLNLIVDTSAVRYRDLYGFMHPDIHHVYRADAGRGVEIVLFGVSPEWRLPLRAYHGGMFFKNGVPAGYVEVLSFFERAEVGFNLYYTFRDGETAWIYAQLLKLCRQLLGVTHYHLDPYQIGHENEEAIESGALWFYRKLGFRSVDPGLARLMEKEERRMRSDPARRTPARTLRKLSSRPMIYEPPGAKRGEWDAFHIRTLALARWPATTRRRFNALQSAKHGPEEARYLAKMNADALLRAELIRLGSGDSIKHRG